MADKTPVRVVFNSDNVATGMAEFQTGESIAIDHGGTGLTSIGSAGQVLKVKVNIYCNFSRTVATVRYD